MDGESVFGLNRIPFDNLSLLSEKQRKSAEQRSCELAFAADEAVLVMKRLADDGIGKYESLALLTEEIAGLLEAKTEDAFLQIPIFGNQPLYDKLTFAELLTIKSGDSDYRIEEVDFLPEGSAEDTFTYVKNSLSDEAYDVFSENFFDPRVMYADSFREAAFALADGKVDFCILPFEEKGGVRIPGIFSLISSLDLKIADVTPVFGFEGNADMKYALLSRSFRIPERASDTDRYLEIRVTADKKITLAELISAAEALGHTVYKIDTMSLYENGENADFHSVVLKDGGGSFASFLTFMTLFAESSYTPVGIYKNIE